MRLCQVNIEGHNVVLLVAQNERKSEPEVIAKTAVTMSHLSKDSIQGHFTRNIFFVLVFTLGQITIRVQFRVRNKGTHFRVQNKGTHFRVRNKGTQFRVRNKGTQFVSCESKLCDTCEFANRPVLSKFKIVIHF